MTRARPRAVLFDLDGTLLDSADLIITAFRETCQARLGMDVDREDVLAAWSLPIRHRFRALVPGHDEEDLARDYLRRYLRLHDTHARLFPSVPHVLDALRARGYRLAVVTSKRRATTQAAVHAFGLARWFSVLVTDDDVAFPKPDPEPVRMAGRQLGIPLGETLMVGDSPLDIAAGLAAGALTAGALWGTMDAKALADAGPDHLLDRPEDLLTLCPPL